jgi:lycopene beta-cyclase
VSETFDFIIAGGGMAGLSLAFYLNQSSFRNQKVLIIDREIKAQNDHTWSFWETEKNPFEQIIYRKWNGVWFHGTRDFSKFLSLENYVYKLIRAVDFYEFVFSQIKENPDFTFLQAEISAVENDLVKTNQGDFRAEKFIFDSFTRKNYDNPKYQNLWQHFLGWVIETKEKKFKPDEPTLFDFRVEQKDECRFLYILPFSENKALIEFTIFSDNLLPKTEYEENLKKYISEILKISDYKISETEYGVIPMSDEPHEEFPAEKTIRIGTSGGYVKASTGYSFQQTQRRLQKLVEDLENGKWKTENRKWKMWKSYLDSVLLNVLLTKKHPADDVFTHLFRNNKASQVLKFLDEDTSFAEDLRIMRSVPLLAFSKAAIKTALKKISASRK